MASFFVSYTNVDQTHADWITWVLREAGHEVIFQPWDLWSVDNCIFQTKQTLENTDITILVLSQDYLKYEFTQPKWIEIFDKNLEGKACKLLSIRIRECHPMGFLSSITCVDLVGIKAEQARRIILDTIQEQGLTLIKPSLISPNNRSRREQSASVIESNTDTAVKHNNLETFYGDDEDENRNTEILLQEALARSRLLPNNSPNVVHCLYRLGWFYYEQNPITMPQSHYFKKHYQSTNAYWGIIILK